MSTGGAATPRRIYISHDAIRRGHIGRRPISLGDGAAPGASPPRAQSGRISRSCFANGLVEPISFVRVRLPAAKHTVGLLIEFEHPENGGLRNKAKAAGHQGVEFSTRTPCLSQFDHIDGTYSKKPLKQRHHQFSDGSRVQRDLYSAFLSRFVSESRLDASQAAQSCDWGGRAPASGAGRS